MPFKIVERIQMLLQHEINQTEGIRSVKKSFLHVRTDNKPFTSNVKMNEHNEIAYNFFLFSSFNE